MDLADFSLSCAVGRILLGEQQATLSMVHSSSPAVTKHSLHLHIFKAVTNSI